MSVFSERPRDMRSQAGDNFDFEGSQRMARQGRPAPKAAAARGRQAGGAQTGPAAFAIGAMLTYWLAPALLSRAQPRPRPRPRPEA